MPTRLASVKEVQEAGSYLFTAIGPHDNHEEVTVVPCEDGVEAWQNTCTHEQQRLDRGGDVGVMRRDGHLVCPKHGSLFDTCDGSCDTGPAAGSRLVSVAVAVNRGDVYLTDDAYDFEHAGGLADGDAPPDSTSHLRF